MQDQDQYTDHDNGLRLEDISRRSACDRCRRMKTRCERSNLRDIAQLQQCRRCRQAHVKCITTLEAQHHQADDSGKPNQRNWKQPRAHSFGSNSSCLVPENQGNFCEQQQHHHHHMGRELPRRSTGENSSAPFNISTGSRSDDDLLASHELDHQWHDLNENFDLEGPSIHNSLATTSSTNGNSDTNFIEGMTITSATMQSILNTPFNPTPQDSGNGFLHSLSTPLGPNSSSKTIMSQLMEFNNKVSQDLQEATDTGGPWGDGKSTLGKTLQHAVLFLELLATFSHSRDGFDGASSGSESAGSRYGPTSTPPGRSDKVDTDIALQLLSCNMNVCNLYRRLYTELTTQSWQLEEAQALPALRLEGLQSLDIEMRVQVLVHMCSLTFVKIQTELDLLRRRGWLTQTADRTFQIVLGMGNEGTLGREFGMEQTLDNFRRLLMSKGLLTT